MHTSTYAGPNSLDLEPSLLTSAQAMADFALLIQSFKADHSADSSAVIAFGGSYGGMVRAAAVIVTVPQCAKRPADYHARAPSGLSKALRISCQRNITCNPASCCSDLGPSAYHAGIRWLAACYICYICCKHVLVGTADDSMQPAVLMCCTVGGVDAGDVPEHR